MRSIRRSIAQLALLCGCTLLSTGYRETQAAPPGLLKMFNKSEGAKVAAKDAKQLSEIDGPWMILAATFAGAEGEAQARALADELTAEIGAQTFIHREDFKFGGKRLPAGPDGKTRRYANESDYVAFAVLVGEYDSVDHPQLIKDLKRIKATQPKSMSKQDESAAAGDTENSMVAVRKLQRALLKRTGKDGEGPLAGAFATTNPLLPEEYFSAPEVDSFVVELNDQVEHSLLNNRGKFTVVVRTFSGLGALDTGMKAGAFEPSSERMDICAENADTMVKELRKQGVEAYQFHDRTRSLVTIGSFESLGRSMPDGSFEYDPGIRQVMQNYCAGNQTAPSQFGQGIAAKHVASIPFDVKPTPIAVPKKSKRSLYMGKIGMR